MPRDQSTEVAFLREINELLNDTVALKPLR